MAASLKQTIVKRLILTSNTKATKKSQFFKNYVYRVKGIQRHSKLFELKATKNKSRNFNV